MPLFLIDGSNLARRAHSAFPFLSAQGLQLNAVFGTIKMILGMMKEYPPGPMIAFFDTSKSEYRLGLYPDYKKRKPLTEKEDQDLESYYSQLPLLEELLEMMGVRVLGRVIKGIEADDAIAYAATKFSDQYDKAVVVSCDRDLCGTVKERVWWYDPMRSNIINLRNFKQVFGIEIEQYWDYKALVGDQSDNIPHPPGIGPKTAAKLLNQYGTIASMLEIRHEKIFPHSEVLALGQKLVTLNLHELFPELKQWSCIEAKLASKPTISNDLRSAFEVLEFRTLTDKWSEILPLLESFAS